LYRDAALWAALREAAMLRLGEENNPALYRERLAAILAGLVG
jgi:hypothetical protein